MNGRKLYLIGMIIGFIVILISIVLIVFTNNSLPNPPQSKQITPTPFAATNPTAAPHAGQPPVPYYSEGSKKLLEYVQAQKKLTPSDQQTRDHLVQLAQENSGVVHTTSTYTIYYYEAADGFQAEIDDPAIATTKKEINDWLISQGMSAQGICYLPLGLYVGYQVAQSGQIDVIPFSPLPLGC